MNKEILSDIYVHSGNALQEMGKLLLAMSLALDSAPETAEIFVTKIYNHAASIQRKIEEWGYQPKSADGDVASE